MIIEVVIFVLVFLLFFVKWNKKLKGLPPGEFGLPIIGYFPKSNETLTDMIDRLRAKHGDIFAVMMGSNLTVFLCDYEMVRTALAKNSTAGRPDVFSLNFFRNSKNAGIIMSSGHKWISNRHFALKVLKHFGFGKSTLEDKVKLEIEYFLSILKQNVDKPFKVGETLSVIVLNIVWSIIAGKRFNIEDDELTTFTTLVNEVFTAGEGPMKYLDMYPWIIPYVPEFVKNSWMKLDIIRKKKILLNNSMLKVIEECEEKHDKDNPQHYIDMYLIEREEQKDNPEFNYRICDYSDLQATLVDFYLAASDTTSATLKWMFLYMAKYPDIQKKIQKEIDSVVPRSRLPLLEEKSSLPYLEASIYELHRILSYVATNVPHLVSEDIVVDNYIIPKGTHLYGCIQSIQHDKKYWKKPTEFYPEHFLDNEGKFTLQKEGFLPFSLGKRICPGESLAKMELFLFISAILQNFEICEPEGSTINLKPNPIVKMLNVCYEQEIILKNRK